MRAFLSIFILFISTSIYAGNGKEAATIAPNNPSQHAKRLVSLSPHITELLFAAGAGDLLVGAAEYSDYPPEAKSIPRIGGHSGIDYERIVALKPDLIVAWPSGNSRMVINKLRGLGLEVVTSDPDNLDAIANDIEYLGRLAGREKQARQSADDVRRRIQSIRKRYLNRKRLKVFYQIWGRPLMTVNGRHILSEAIRLCGGVNSFAGLAPLTPQVSREAVVLGRPRLVLLPALADMAKRWQSDWLRLQGTAQWRFTRLPPDLLQRPTPRMLDGVEQMCVAIDRVRRDRKNPPHDR